MSSYVTTRALRLASGWVDANTVVTDHGWDDAQIGRLLRSGAIVPAGAGEMSNFVTLTQAEYDALDPDDSTLYIVVG